MKSFARHTIWVLSLAVMVTSMFLTGCGSSDNERGVVGPGVIVPLGPTPNACAAGQVATAYGCLYTATCQSIAPGYGWLPGENRCVAPIAGNSGSGTITSGNFLASLSINDRRTFELMLQNLRVCSPNEVGWNIGNENCENYSHAGYVRIQVPVVTAGTLPAQGSFVIGAGASTPGGYNNGSWTTGGLSRSTGQFPATLGYANGNTGFTGAATFVSNSGQETFRFVVDKLPWNSYQMTVQLQYRGSTFATGTLVAQ